LGCGGAFGKALKRGDELAQRGQWDLAAQQYEQALEIKPNDPTAIAKLAEVRRRQAVERVAKARVLLGQGDLSGALTLVQEAARFDPNNADARALLAEVNGRVLDKAEQLLAADEDHKALELSMLVLKGAPGDERARRIDAQAREKLATAAYQRAEEFAKKGKRGNALLELVLATLYSPGFRDSTARITKLKQELRDEVTFWAVVGTFRGDARAADVSKNLSPDLLAQGIDSGLPLRVVAQAPPGVRPARGIRLTGSVEGYQFNKSQTPAERSCEYVCGKSTVQNRDWADSAKAVNDWRGALSQTQAQVNQEQAEVAKHRRVVDDLQRDVDRAQIEVDRAKLELERCQAPAPGDAYACQNQQRRADEAQRRLGAAQARLDGPAQNLAAAEARLAEAEQKRDGAQNGLSGEESRLASTPRTADVEMQCKHNYVVTTYSVSGGVTVKLTGESLGDRARVWDGEPLRYDTSKQDEAFAAQPGRCAEVASGDPLQLPAEKDIKHDLATQAVAGVRAKIVAAYDQYRQEFLTVGRREEAAGVREEAVESYVRFLLASPSGKDGERQRIRAFLAKARGLSGAALDQAL
jgi:tetratricopeptide (TPR) repeat protein